MSISVRYTTTTKEDTMNRFHAGIENLVFSAEVLCGKKEKSTTCIGAIPRCKFKYNELCNLFGLRTLIGEGAYNEPGFSKTTNKPRRKKRTSRTRASLRSPQKN